MFHTKVVEKIKTHILCSVTFTPPPENRAVYEIMWKNIVDELDRPQIKIWRMRIACWRRMEKISWTDHVRNEDVLLRVKEQRNILHEIRKRKANWIGHILRRN
jgi:hypothetical protein